MAQLNKGDKDIGIAKTDAWLSETMPGVNGRVPVTDFTPPKNDRQKYTNEIVSGNENIADCLEMLNYPEVNFPFTFKMKYDTYYLIWALASIYGQYSCDADTPEAGVNKHNFLWDSLIADTTNLFHTFSWDAYTTIFYVASCLFQGLTITNDNGFQVACNMLGDRVQEYYATGPQTVTSPNVCGGDLCKLGGLTVLMNAESGGALGAGDEVVVNNITLNPVRNYEAAPQQSGTLYAGQPYEPDTPAEYMITMELRSMNAVNALWFATHNAGTRQKMTLTWLGDTISGKTATYTCYLEFPSLKSNEEPTYDFAAPTPVTMVLGIMKAQSAPTGMTLTLPNGYIYNTLGALTGYPTI